MSAFQSPFLRQCFVATGVAMNLAHVGLMMGFTSGTMEQLKETNSTIRLDVSTGSWFASLPCLSNFIGNLIAPSMMSKYGRKTTNLLSIVPLIIGWICIFFASNIYVLLIGRIFQGLFLGIVLYVAPLLMGEYTSPINRGAFTVCIPFSCSAMVLLVHQIVEYIYWKTACIICVGYSVINMVIILLSPESPSWFVEKGRYDECRKAFRWLRGDKEEIELEKLIKSNILLNNMKKVGVKKESYIKNLYNITLKLKTSITKKDFYKPVLILAHMSAIIHWSAANALSSFSDEFIRNVINSNKNLPIQVLAADINRTLTGLLSTFVIKKVKRRVILFSTVVLNIISLLLISGYTLAAENEIINRFPLLEIILLHLLIFSYSIGALPLCFTLNGEVLPLEHKILGGGLCIIVFSLNYFLSLKTFPYFITSFKIYGTCFIYALILLYGLIVTGSILPETKDRTLQEIEEEFKGNNAVLDLMTVEPLATRRNSDSEIR